MTALAQDWRQELQQDLVMVDSGKMLMEDVGLLKITIEGYEPKQFQVRTHAEAPLHGGISRDNFVSMATMMFTMTLISGFAEAYQVPASQFIAGYDFTDLKSAIGTPDFEINLFMTDEGMQFEFANTQTKQTNRWTMTWAEVYGK